MDPHVALAALAHAAHHALVGALVPRILDVLAAAGQRKEAAVGRDGGGSERRGEARVLQAPLARGGVPDRRDGVAAERGECAVSTDASAKVRVCKARLTHVGWKAMALTGYTVSMPSTTCRWHLKAYFCACASGDGAKNSTAMRPSTDADA